MARDPASKGQYRHLRPALRRLNPFALADGIAAVLSRAPQATLLFLIMLSTVTGLATMGIRAVTAWPLAAALVVAGGLVGLQVLIVSSLKARHSGLRIKAVLFGAGLAISSWNMMSAAGGLSAAQPDSLGRAFIQQQLHSQIDAVNEGSQELDSFAAAMDQIAAYSAQMDSIERGVLPWRPTCRGSAKPGPGDFAKMRAEDASKLADPRTGLATQVRQLATQAQTALRAAEKIRDGYQRKDHTTAVDGLRAQTNVARQALSSPVVGEAISWLAARRLQIKGGRPILTGRKPVCADDELRGLIANAIDVSASSKPGVPPATRKPPQIPPPFVDPAEPSERTAVLGLAHQLSLAVIFYGYSLVAWLGVTIPVKAYPDFDLSPWYLQLAAGPLLDLLLITSMSMLRASSPPQSLDEEVAERVGRGDVNASDIQGARARAVRGDYMITLHRYLHVRASRFTLTSKLIVPLEHREFQEHLDDLVWSGRAYEGGTGYGDATSLLLGDDRIAADGQYRTVVLRPGQLRRLLDEDIVRHALALRQASSPEAKSRRADDATPEFRKDTTTASASVVGSVA